MACCSCSHGMERVSKETTGCYHEVCYPHSEQQLVSLNEESRQEEKI